MMDASIDRKLLKMDLQIMTDKMDEWIDTLITSAESMIQREGIKLTQSDEDRNLVRMYAAYLYRKRREPTAGMPRMLRYALNNRLFSAKAGE